MNDLTEAAVWFIAEFVLQMALAVVLTIWIVRRDLRSAPPERLARAWNKASFWSAVGVFGPFCLPFHFFRTRRSVAGVFIGIAWAVGVLVAVELAGEALDAFGPHLEMPSLELTRNADGGGVTATLRFARTEPPRVIAVRGAEFTQGGQAGGAQCGLSRRLRRS